MPTVGNVTMGPGVTLTCPEASSFADTAGGLYGFASYAVQCPYCNSSLYNLVLASSLQFTCTPCAEGLYSLRAGHSDGSPGVAVNYPCLACPQGGLCTGGTVVATPGYWGQPDGNDTVTFAVCPAGGLRSVHPWRTVEGTGTIQCCMLAWGVCVRMGDVEEAASRLQACDVWCSFLSMRYADLCATLLIASMLKILLFLL